MSTESQTPNHSAIEMSPADSKEYADYQQFKRFQAYFNSQPKNMQYTSSPSMKPLTLTPSARQYPSLPVRSNSMMIAVEEAEWHGFLSQRFHQIANPAPLGLCAFAVTTFVLSMYNAGAFVPSFGANGVAAALAMAYGGLVQLLAGMWEFKTGNSFGALAFSSYGGFWLSFAFIKSQEHQFVADYGTDSGQLTNALGVWFFGWTLFTFFMLIAAHRTSVALVSLFFFLTITFLLLTIAEFQHDVYVHQAAGAFGILTSAIAFYAAFAGLLDRKTQNSLFTLPVGDLKKMFPTKEELAAQQAKSVV